MPITATGDSLIIPSIQLTIIRFDPHQAAASQYVFKMTSGFKNHSIHATQSRSLITTTKLSANQHNYFEFTSMCLFLVHVMIIPESGFPNRESRCSNMSDPALLQIAARICFGGAHVKSKKSFTTTCSTTFPFLLGNTYEAASAH